MLDRWYKTAVIYSLDVERFADGNGDGLGDFQGLIRRLDHIAGLGVDCIWLLPFYPSPNRDNGYDVIDYYNIDRQLGSLGDFVEFMHHCRRRGLRVIIDLVVNHTSDQHPWFQAACQDENSPYRDFYIWSKDRPDNIHQGMVFPGEQHSTWTYHEQAQAWYFHRFYHHQPDLNTANPRVRDEICKIIGFWLELGVSGFRLDAVPFIIEEPILGHGSDQDSYEYLHQFRDYLSWRKGDAVFIAEANVEPQKMPQYFSGGHGMHMLFNFYAVQHLFLALARQQTDPIAQSFQEMPEPPDACQYANFLRNHDELDLARLSESEREEVAQAFAPDENMWVFHRGIRRRLPPMLGGDRQRLEMAYSLMLSLPGTPVIRYGDEIAMGDDLSLPGRDSVRAAMQWSDGPNAGFSTASAERLQIPVINSGEYSYQQCNVVDQRRQDNSFLSWIRQLINVRKECPELGYGTLQILDSGHSSVLMHRCEWESGGVIAMHNLSDQEVRVQLPIDQDGDEYLVELLGDRRFEHLREKQEVELPRYGYRWFRIGGRNWKLP